MLVVSSYSPGGVIEVAALVHWCSSTTAIQDKCVPKSQVLWPFGRVVGASVSEVSWVVLVGNWGSRMLLATICGK